MNTLTHDATTSYPSCWYYRREDWEYDYNEHPYGTDARAHDGGGLAASGFSGVCVCMLGEGELLPIVSVIPVPVLPVAVAAGLTTVEIAAFTRLARL